MAGPVAAPLGGGRRRHARHGADRVRLPRRRDPATGQPEHGLHPPVAALPEPAAGPQLHGRPAQRAVPPPGPAHRGAGQGRGYRRVRRAARCRAARPHRDRGDPDRPRADRVLPLRPAPDPPADLPDGPAQPPAPGGRPGRRDVRQGRRVRAREPDHVGDRGWRYVRLAGRLAGPVPPAVVPDGRVAGPDPGEYRLAEDYLIVPRVIGKVIEVPATVTLVAVLFGGATLGIVGALVAIPVAASIRIILHETVFPRLDRL
ncbi:MAG: AI-2E family transporter [Actinobacteria bacterium]|nr:MAG: AI-2E family transporter [Actinomycetota bacterium]